MLVITFFSGFLFIYFFFIIAPIIAAIAMTINICAIVKADRDEHFGVKGLAIAGICLSGLIIVFFLLLLVMLGITRAI